MWSKLVDGVTDFPIVAARLHDLLWERRWGARADLHARAAIDAYLASAATVEEDLDRARDYCRALELARAINDEELIATLIPPIIEAAKVSLQSVERQPGVALRLVETLIDLPPRLQPDEIDGLLAEARATYGDDPFIVQTVLDLVSSRLTDPDARGAAYEEQVAAWRDKANISTGVTKLSFLRRAQELARMHDLRDLAEEAGREIQEIELGESDLKEFSSSVSIPIEEAEAYVEQLLGVDWQESLTRYGAIGPPSGDYEKNLRMVKKNMIDFPLQFLFSKTIIGAHNMPIREVRTEEDHRNQALIQHEAMGISVDSHFRADALDRLRDRFGVPARDDLVEFFETPLIRPDVADSIARALELYWQESYDEAAHVILPRLEVVIRSIALAMHIVVVRPPRGEAPGGVRGLGDLLNALAGHYDESWRRYVKNALSEPTGLNLRNALLHGLIARADREQAAILLQLACQLRLVRVGPTDANSEERSPAL